LAANAAMRSGCGKVMLAMPQPLLQSGLSMAPVATGIELPVDEVGRLIPSAAIEAIDTHAAGCRCLVIGPGFGCDWSQQQILATLLSREDRPIILDADGINAFAQLESGQLELKAPTIMTPHVGEFTRLANANGVSGQSVEALAQALGCVVVLKSSTTHISNGWKQYKTIAEALYLLQGEAGMFYRELLLACYLSLACIVLNIFSKPLCLVFEFTRCLANCLQVSLATLECSQPIYWTVFRKRLQH
ncbi:MAG TPA: NAD(P)H-hydrate dehydratase, partial [Phycisphaerales bacterium]|nr:NAD(P)H-hydrate dehydratase [Phycisphaerales bacterium]